MFKDTQSIEDKVLVWKIRKEIKEKVMSFKKEKSYVGH